MWPPPRRTCASQTQGTGPGNPGVLSRPLQSARVMASITISVAVPLTQGLKDYSRVFGAIQVKGILLPQIIPALADLPSYLKTLGTRLQGRKGSQTPASATVTWLAKVARSHGAKGTPEQKPVIFAQNDLKAQGKAACPLGLVRRAKFRACRPATGRLFKSTLAAGRPLISGQRKVEGTSWAWPQLRAICELRGSHELIAKDVALCTCA